MNSNINTDLPHTQDQSTVNPQLMKVMADSQSKKRIFAHWCIFFILIIVLIVSSIAVPKPILELDPNNTICETYDVTQLQQEISNICRPFDPYISLAYFNHLKIKNQFLLVKARFKIDILQDIAVQKLNYTISAYAITENQGKLTLKSVLLENKKHTISTSCEQDEGQGKQQDSDEQGKQKGQDRRQNQQNYDPQICDEFVAFYEPNLEHSNYLILVNYQQSDTLRNLIASQVQLLYLPSTVKVQYTDAMLVIRYFFFTISLGAAVIYYLKLKQLKRKHWVIEQKFVLILSGLLILFNEDFYALTILHPNRVSAVFGVIFFSNFVSLLFLYWLILYDRINNENGQKETKTLTKLKCLVCFFIWLFFVVSYSILVNVYHDDPSTNWDDLHEKAFLAFKVLSIILSLSVLLYLLRYLIQFCQRYENRLWRYKLIGLFNIFFMMCLGLFIVSGSFDLYNLVGTEVLICIGILNVYIYYQQYMWMPSKEGLQEQDQININELAGTELNNGEYEQLEIDNIEINNQQLEDIQDEKQQQVILEGEP